MSDTKVLEKILNWKLNPLANSENPMVTRDDFSRAATELAQLKLAASGHYIKGGAGSHWDGCEETHYDCKIAQLEQTIAQLRAELEKETQFACEMRASREGWRNTAETATARVMELRTAQDEANENLLSMVNQYCCVTVKQTGMPDTYSHDFMSTGEAAFEYLVAHGLAKWCKNGVDIYDLQFPSVHPEEKK